MTTKYDMAKAEIEAYAKANKAVRIESFTFKRWAEALKQCQSLAQNEIENYAAHDMGVKVQPYTFARWAKDL